MSGSVPREECRESRVQRDHYNRVGTVYVQARQDPRHVAYREELWSRVFRRISDFAKTRGSQVKGLEAMCGAAEISNLLASSIPHLRMDAFDYSDQMVNEAKSNATKSVSVYQEDVLELSRRDEYDFAIVIGGLHHVPDSVSMAVSNLRNALKSGGLFVSFEPTHNNPIWRWVRECVYKKNSVFEENSERGFALKDLNTLLTDGGFEISEQFYPGLLGYLMYYNPEAFPLLNVGPTSMARLLAKLDLVLSKSPIGYYFSFATWTFARKSS